VGEFDGEGVLDIETEGVRDILLETVTEGVRDMLLETVMEGVTEGVLVGVGDGSKHPKASCTRPVT
jgi:hypothetical protein